MTDIEQIKLEVDQSMTQYRHYRDNRDMARSIVNKTIDYLHSRGYLGGVWQPIETAPKDGTVIWGYWKHATQAWQGPVMYFIDFEGDEKWVTDEYRDINTTPTHWQPLPTAPNTFKKDENVSVSSKHIDAVKVPEKNIKTFDAWFVFDGDVNGLAEFCDALNWNSFKKGGRDKKGNLVIFLVDGDESIGAIRSRSNKLHIAALDYLMGYAAPKGETK